MAEDHYKLLGVPHDSSTDRIRRAYLEKVRTLHPDINPSKGAHLEFIRLKEAYDILMDAGKRNRYDLQLKQAATSKERVKNFHYDFESNLGGAKGQRPAV